MLNKYVLWGTLDKYFNVKRLKNVTFLPWLSSFCAAASGWLEISRWVECMEMKSKSQMGDDYGGHISRGCKARRATSDESKEGQIREFSLSLCFSNWLLFLHSLFQQVQRKYECDPWIVTPQILTFYILQKFMDGAFLKCISKYDAQIWLSYQCMECFLEMRTFSLHVRDFQVSLILILAARSSRSPG